MGQIHGEILLLFGKQDQQEQQTLMVVGTQIGLVLITLKDIASLFG